MGMNIRKDLDSFLYGMAQAHNALCRDATVVGARFHADVTSSTTGDYTQPASTALKVASANATDLPSTLAIANEALAKLNIHMADAMSHQVADTTNGPVANAVAAVDQGTANTLLNLLKATFNAHLTQVISSVHVHFNDDSTNTVAAANASNASTSQTLANAIKASYNAHIISAPGGGVGVSGAGLVLGND